MIGVLVRRRKLDTDVHAGRRPCEDDRDDAFAKPRTPKVGRKPPVGGEKHGKDSFTAAGRNQSCLDLRLLASTAERQ